MEILLYFRMLPTDPRFRSLNIYQKAMLASGIASNFGVRLELGKGFFDKALLYMNPELWLKEKERSGELPPDKYTKVNFEFKEIQAKGRATGEMPEDTMIMRAMHMFAKKARKNSEKKRVLLSGTLDDLQATVVPTRRQLPPEDDDDATLG